MKSVTENKKQGYSRENPASYANKVKGNKETENNKDEANPKQAETQKKTERVNDANAKFSSKERYCHFFSNFGGCHYEEENGRKCRYSHKKAPQCNFD